MAKKYYRIDLDVTSTAWETCSTYIEAESEEEALAIFDKDPDASDWDDWEWNDGQIRGWEVNNVECDEWMTKHMEKQNETK
jgi:hypothetical protein